MEKIRLFFSTPCLNIQLSLYFNLVYIYIYIYIYHEVFNEKILLNTILTNHFKSIFFYFNYSKVKEKL
jgi:hypothetical protein